MRAVKTTNVVIVEFKPIPGWNLPTNQTVTVSPGNTTVYTALYTTGAPTRLELIRSAGIGISGSTGTTHRLEYRPSLLGGSWLPLSTNTILTDGLNLLMPWPPTNGPRAFYRAVWLP